MHEEMLAQIQEAVTNGKEDSIADAAPRGNAKSTLVSLASVLWCQLYTLKHYIIIISDTSTQADDFLTNIRSELEDNDLIINDFGSQIGDIWTTNDLLTINDVRIQSLGAGKKIRGRRYKQWRPDLIVVDDLENDESVRSSDQRKKLFDWYTKAASKAGDERTDKIFIGTIIHYDSLLTKLLKNPIYKSKTYKAVIEWSGSPLWNDWELIITNLTNTKRIEDARQFFDDHREEMLKGTKVLWPEKEDYYSLMVQRIADGPAAFSSEKQNEPLTDEDRRFLPNWIQYFEDSEIEGKKLYLVAAIDPSMGKAGGDYSAIVVLGMDSNSQIYVLAADMAKRHPDVIASDALALYSIYNFPILGVEDVQFQEFFKDTLARLIRERKLNLIIKGLHTHSDKILRIESLQPDIKNGRIKFRRSQGKLIEQLINFPSADHDDGPDALELAMSLFGSGSSIAQFYKEVANEANTPAQHSFIQDAENIKVNQIGF